MTDKAIEAAARAMCDDELWPGAWIKTNEVEHEAWMRRARAAIAAYETALWQPIETGPRDGTVIDLWFAGDWQKRQTDAVWRPISPIGVWEITNRGAMYNHSPEIITHWRPLPPPPGGEGE